MKRDVWRRYPKLWLPAAVFLLVNLGFLAAYRLVLAEDAELGRGLLARREAELVRLGELRESLEEAWAETQATQSGLAAFYADRLATEERMLTTVIAKVKELAARAGLDPRVIQYDKETFERQGLVMRGFDFRVEGNYQQLRRLINFLELSDSFLILEEIGLAAVGEGGQTLAIDLRISTLFADESVGAGDGGEG